MYTQITLIYAYTGSELITWNLCFASTKTQFSDFLHWQGRTTANDFISRTKKHAMDTTQALTIALEKCQVYTKCRGQWFSNIVIGSIWKLKKSKKNQQCQFIKHKNFHIKNMYDQFKFKTRLTGKYFLLRQLYIGHICIGFINSLSGGKEGGSPYFMRLAEAGLHEFISCMKR